MIGRTKQKVHLPMLIIWCVFLFNGCNLIDTAITQNMGSINVRGSATIKYYTDSQDTFIQCVSEIENLTVYRKGVIYRIRPFSEGRLKMTALTQENGISDSYAVNQHLKSLFDDGIITMIEINDGSISFHNDFASVSKGIVWIPSNQPEDIPGYSAKMSFVNSENGYLGIEDGTDNSFFYVPIENNWYYFEIRY